MTPNLNNPARDQIARDVQAFLDRGGKIKVLPYSPDALKALAEAPETVFTKHAARLAAARAKGMSSWRRQELAKFNNNDTSPAKQRERAQARKNRFKKAEKAEVAA